MLTSRCFLANSSLSFLSSSFLKIISLILFPYHHQFLNTQGLSQHLRAPSGLLPSKAAISSSFLLIEVFFSSITASSSLQERRNSASAFLIFSLVEISFRSLLSSCLSSGLVVACTLAAGKWINMME